MFFRPKNFLTINFLEANFFGIPNRYFLLKTDIHMKISNTEPILRYFRGLRYLQNKTRFQNRQVHIHTDLKWSSQYQNGLEMTRLAPDCPGDTLKGPQVPPTCPNWSLRGYPDHSGACSGISKPL